MMPQQQNLLDILNERVNVKNLSKDGIREYNETVRAIFNLVDVTVNQYSYASQLRLIQIKTDALEAESKQ